jgi:hypothetical protein
MRALLLKVLTIASLTAGLGAGAAAAAGVTPGFAQDGVLAPSGHVRYTAVSHGSSTVVQAASAPYGRVLRSTTLRREYGVPLVAYDGTAGGLTRDGKLLVLETAAGKPSTRFTVLATANLSVQQSFSLRGTWAYDALSPGGKTLYLIQNLPSTYTIRYLVRAYDLGLHQLVKGAIADKSEKGAMTGYPISRIVSADGTWAYTLYQRAEPGAKPFIHALNTTARVAFCIDLDWAGSSNNLGNVHLTLSPDEKQLVIRRVADDKAVMTVPAPS